MDRKRVYVAGPYSANNVLDVLRNIGFGEKMCGKLFSLGFAPFCPWHDKSFIIQNPEKDFTVADFYSYSLAWLEVSDAMLVIGDWRSSKGTINEIRYARSLEIPVFFTLEELFDWQASF